MDLSKTLRLGGQALPEGILIKGPKYIVVAYRDKLNDIDFVTLEWSFKLFDYLRKIPFIRGLITIFERREDIKMQEFLKHLQKG